MHQVAEHFCDAIRVVTYSKCASSGGNFVVNVKG